MERSSRTCRISPACGTPSNPKISTGVEGSAKRSRFPLSLNIDLILPETPPTSTLSSGRRVPFWISTVATGPRPLSSSASMIVPTADAFGLALRSWRSATSRIISSSPSILIFDRAETSTEGTSPPYSSTITSAAASCSLIRPGFAVGRSILLIATIIGTPAAFTCAMASRVCGITPSSAATTSTTISVAWAPRARIAVKASWPGVSRKVILR